MAEQNEIAEVIKNIQADITTIVRGEIALATEELKPEAAKAGIIAGLFGGAGYLTLSAAAVLFSAFAFLWAMGFQSWFGLELLPALFWGFLVMGVVMLLLAGIMALVGTKIPKPGPPTQAIANVKEEVEFVKGAVADASAAANKLSLTGSTPTSTDSELEG